MTLLASARSTTTTWFVSFTFSRLRKVSAHSTHLELRECQKAS